MKSLLTAALYLFIVSAFILPTEAAFSLVFYSCVMPLAALTLPVQRSVWRTTPPGVLVALALILWSGLSLLWGEDDGGRSLRFALGAVATGAFVLAVSDVLKQDSSRQRLALVLICAATANAVFVLQLNMPGLLRGDRILGWGITRQPILGGSVMAVACLSALSRCLAGRRKPAATLLYGTASALMASFVLAMQSRGALVGLAGGATVIALNEVRLHILVMAAVVAGLLELALPTGPKQDLYRMLLERGTSHRLEIWAETLSLIQEKPLFGHGLAANLPFSHTGFPHSLYLSLLFYSGTIGFALFATLGALVTIRLLRVARQDRIWVTALWVNALLAGLTDFGQITKGPGPLWFILWLPILLTISLPVRPPASNRDPSAAAT